MDTETKKMLEIIDDTVNFYSEDPAGRRGKTEWNCCYCTDEGKRCAVGRYLSDEELQNIRKVDLLTEKIVIIISKLMILKNEIFYELPMGFWHRLQLFHDNDSHWDDLNKGLSEIGKVEYESFKKSILNGAIFQ